MARPDPVHGASGPIQDPLVPKRLPPSSKQVVPNSLMPREV